MRLALGRALRRSRSPGARGELVAVEDSAPVPADFADELDGGPAARTDVLGVGGRVPLLAQWNSLDEATSFLGGRFGGGPAGGPLSRGGIRAHIQRLGSSPPGASRQTGTIADQTPWPLSRESTAAVMWSAISA